MPDMYPYSEESLAEMFSLTQNEISSIIKTEGVPYFLKHKKEFVGYLPSLKSLFKLTHKTKQILNENVKPHNYELQLTDSTLIGITSLNPSIPASSFLSLQDWYTLVTTTTTVKNGSLLIPQKINVPVYYGNKKVINRLADNFTGDIVLIDADKLINKWRI